MILRGGEGQPVLNGEYIMISCLGFLFRNCVVELNQQCTIDLRIREELSEKQYIKGRFNFFPSDS